MKRIIALLLVCVMTVTGCGKAGDGNQKNASEGLSVVVEDGKTETSNVSQEEQPAEVQDNNGNETSENSKTVEADTAEADTAEGADNYEYQTEEINFNNLNDPELLQYVQDNVYAGLESEFQSDDYVINEVNAIYISKEYLEELEYNSQSNIFFGLTLEELDKQFQGKKYVFTLGENGETAVVEFEDYDDTYDRALKNIAIGTGVILVCVTVSVVTAGAGAPAVSLIFAASAKTGTTFALSSGAISALTAGVVEGYKTKDFDSALKAAALAGSEGFKWGAITGAVTGGLVKNHELHTIRTPEQSEAAALKLYDGKSQLSYKNGREVAYGTKEATRPDVVRTVGDHLEAIEVKNYDLRNADNRRVLYYELKRQISERAANMPKGTTQRVVLDIRGRKYPKELVEDVINHILSTCSDVYPNIPVDLLTY